MNKRYCQNHQTNVTLAKLIFSISFVNIIFETQLLDGDLVGKDP